MFIRRSAAALVLAASLTPALAQPNVTQPPGALGGVRAAGKAEPSQHGPRLSVDFPGGTVQAYIDALRQAAGAESVNVIVSDTAATAELPAIRLRDVNLYTALEAATSAAQTGPGWNWDVRPFASDPESKPAFAMVLKVLQSFPTADTAGTLRVFNLAEVLAQSGIQAETALTAVQAALEVLGGPTPAQLKFHKETGLLFVSGTTAQLGAAGDVLAQLSEGSRMTEHAKRTRLEQERAQQLLRPRFEAALETARARLAAAQADHDNVAQAVKAGSLPQSEAKHAQVELAVAREQIVAVESQLALIESPEQASRELNMAGFWDRLANLERQVVALQRAMGVTPVPAAQPQRPVVPSR